MATYVVVMAILVQYLASIGFYLSQGWLIQVVVQSPSTNVLGHVLAIASIMIGTKLLMMASAISVSQAKEFFAAKELEIQLRRWFPSRVYKDFVSRGNVIFQGLTQYVPKYIKARYDLIWNQWGFHVISGIMLITGIYQGFYLGIGLLVGIAVTTWLQQCLFANRVERQVHELESNYQYLVQWVSEYFSAYKEIAKAWGRYVRQGQWARDQLTQYTHFRQQLNYTLLKKDIAAQLLVELPFVIALLTVLLAVYTQFIGLTQAFVWIGLAQNMLSAAQNLGQNVELKKNRDAALSQIQHSIDLLQTSPSATPLMASGQPSPVNKPHVTFRLYNGQLVNIGIQPGIYWIKAANGSGKSTLLDVLAGYDRQADYHQTPAICWIKQQIAESHMRVIVSEPVIFSSLTSWEQQIAGPNYQGQDIESRLARSPLATSLVHSWLQIYRRLRDKWHTHVHYSLSSGERVLLSFLRCLYSWDDSVSLLLVDECDSSLDQTNIQLFHGSLSSLGRDCPVYYVAHHSNMSPLNWNRT